MESSRIDGQSDWNGRLAHARGDAHGGRQYQQQDSLLSSLVLRDVWQGPRDSADRTHTVPPPLAVWLRQGFWP